MEFYIRKGSSLPILKMKMIDDGKNDKDIINEMIENSSIYFNMFDYKSNLPVILNQPCKLAIRREKYNQELNEYSILYQFKDDETSKIGKYEATFTIEFLDTNLNATSKLIVPIKEKLFINII